LIIFSRFSHLVLTGGCTYAAERATGEGEGDREQDEGDRDGEEGTGVVLREEDGREETAEEAASTIDNFTCGGSIPLCYPTRFLSVQQHQTTSKRFHEGNRGDKGGVNSRWRYADRSALSLSLDELQSHPNDKVEHVVVIVVQYQSLLWGT